jgi:signal transduction histidine kinase
MIDYLNSRSRAFIVATAGAGIVLLGVIDYLTGRELFFSIFYLLPVSAVAWFLGRRAGLVASVAAATSWLLAELADHAPYSSPAVPFWNTSVRMAFFVIVTLTLSSLRLVRQRQESLMQFIVHDLRSPLAIILTGLQTLEEGASETMDPSEQQIVQHSISAGNHMLSLINSLLDLPHLRSGKMPLQIAGVDAKQLVESVVRSMEPWAQRRQMTLAVECGEGAEPVHADEQLLSRVLVNLLSNAVKFSPSGSTISIRVSPAQGEMLAFQVVDQGPGIPQEWWDRIFDKFVRVEAHDQGTSLGSGLGLNFCRLAVEAQGGRIWLESSGQGSAFTFILPTVNHRSRRGWPLGRSSNRAI